MGMGRKLKVVCEFGRDGIGVEVVSDGRLC